MAEAVVLTIAPAGDVVVVDLWTDTVPGFAGLRAIQVEPRRWWLIDAGDSGAAIAAAVGNDAIVTAIGGGLVRATLAGAGWRALLMIGGVFDAEDPGFGPGAVAATVIHHVPVWIVPATDGCDAFFAASYAAGLVDLWTAAIDRGVI